MQTHPQTPETPATRHCRVPSSDTTPKLDQHPDSTNSTHARYEKHFPATTGVEWTASRSFSQPASRVLPPTPSHDAPTPNMLQCNSTKLREVAMDFGMFTMYMVREGAPQVEAFREWMKLIELSEEVGLDSVWLGETHFRPQRAVLASPLVVAGAVAARTSRINVGIAVQVLPLANPVRVAEEAAMIDHMSEGRLVFGVGRSSFLESYQGYNVDYGESRARYFESLEIILRAWGDEPFSFEGEFYSFQNVNVVPKPYQKPHPPIRVAVESRDTFRMIGSSGYPIFIRHQMSIAELQDLLSEYQGTRLEAGFEGPNDVIVQIPAYVAETADQAFEEPRESMMRGRRLVLEAINETADQEAYERLKALSEVPYEQVVDRTAFGTPEAVVERLQMYEEELGATGFSIDFNPGGQIPHELIVNSMRLFGDKVVPNFR